MGVALTSYSIMMIYTIGEYPLLLLFRLPCLSTTASRPRPLLRCPRFSVAQLLSPLLTPRFLVISSPPPPQLHPTSQFPNHRLPDFTLPDHH
jgi:hypothetical protein